MFSKPNNLKANDIKTLLFRTYLRYQKGEISDSAAYKEAYLLNSMLKAIQVTDLETKLENIENILKQNEKRK